jgi:hypothetical protein
VLEVERIILKNTALFDSTLKETGSIHFTCQFIIRATKNVNPDENWEFAPGKTLQTAIWFFNNNVSTYV